MHSASSCTRALICASASCTLVALSIGVKSTSIFTGMMAFALTRSGGRAKTFRSAYTSNLSKALLMWCSRYVSSVAVPVLISSTSASTVSASVRSCNLCVMKICSTCSVHLYMISLIALMMSSTTEMGVYPKCVHRNSSDLASTASSSVLDWLIAVVMLCCCGTAPYCCTYCLVHLRHC